MTIDSKVLFQQLVRSITIDADASEKGAIVYLILEQRYNISRTDIMKGKEVDSTESLFNETVRRINTNEPIQYILGEAYFYGRKFVINNSVLIPRPETELLVESVIDKLKAIKNPSIVDVGTGSGCIAVSLSLELPLSTVFATDISKSALEMAQKNAKRLGANINFQLHDILSNRLDFGPFDLIVSNPPYISENEKTLMEKNVVEHEPMLALFVPDDDPLKFYRSLAEQAAMCLKSGGYLITEINERFGTETAAIFSNTGLVEIVVVKDLDGKDRLVMARKL